jgi:hypothetical protein
VAVESLVVSNRESLEILGAVVGAVSVAVMHLLAWLESAAEVGFDYGASVWCLAAVPADDVGATV